MRNGDGRAPPRRVFYARRHSRAVHDPLPPAPAAREGPCPRASRLGCPGAEAAAAASAACRSAKRHFRSIKLARPPRQGPAPVDARVPLLLNDDCGPLGVLGPPAPDPVYFVERRRGRSVLHPPGRRARPHAPRRFCSSTGRLRDDPARRAPPLHPRRRRRQRWLSIESPGRIDDPQAVEKSGRATAHGRALLPPRFPAAGVQGAARRGNPRLSGQAQQRISRLPLRPDSARRGRLGRRRLPICISHLEFPAARRARPPAARLARHLRRPRRLDLQLRPPRPRLPPRGHPLPVSTLQRRRGRVHFLCHGQFHLAPRRGAGFISLHPAGIIHGPHPGAYENSIGAKRTDELAVMLDTARPLQQATAALEIEDLGYMESFIS